MRHEWSTFEAQALMAAKSASVAQIVSAVAEIVVVRSTAIIVSLGRRRR